MSTARHLRSNVQPIRPSDRSAHGGKLGDIAINGQESNATTRRLALVNLAIRGLEAADGPEHADTFRRDLHPDLPADFVLANPPFKDSDRRSEAETAEGNWSRDDDVRWRELGRDGLSKATRGVNVRGVHQFGVPPKAIPSSGGGALQPLTARQAQTRTAARRLIELSHEI